MQLSLSQAIVLTLVLLDGAQGAAIPRQLSTVLSSRDAHAARLIVLDAVVGSELPPKLSAVVAGLNQHAERGLLDPVTGILGALPGLLTGLLGTVGDIVGGLVGALGNVLVTDPSTGAPGMHVFLIQASNMTLATVAAANATNPSVLAAVNMSSADAVLATLHVPVVNQTTMNIVDMCITSTGPGANAVTASACEDKSLAQLFVYNSVTNAVFSVPDLLSCAYAADNATDASMPTDGSMPADAPLGGTANIIMVERDAPMMSTCNATSKAIMFTPSNGTQAPNTNQAVVTVTPSPGSSVGNIAATTVGGASGAAMDYAAGDHAGPGSV